MDFDTNSYQAVVIGGGPGGYVGAIRLGQLGLKTALVDAGGLGGTCLRHGCIPSKALLGISKTVVQARYLIERGLAVGEIQAIPQALRAHKDQVVKQLSDGIASLLKANKVDWIQGYARLAGRGKVEVQQKDGTIMLQTQSILLTSGSHPTVLPHLPVDGKEVWSSEHALEVPEIPERLCVVGGGYIGLELATLFARLGSAVTVVELQDQLMPGTDRDLVTQVAANLKRLGIVVLTKTLLDGFERTPDGLLIQIRRKDKPETLWADKILVSIGRRPASKDLGLETVGLQTNAQGYIDVDDRMATRVAGIYAAGDLAGPPLLAHKAQAEAEIAAEAMAGLPAQLSATMIPGVAFTDPEVAFVGLTETQAKEQDIPFLKGRFPYAALGRAIADSAANGYVKVLIDPQTHQLLGVGIVGHSAGELIAEATLAIEANITAEQISTWIHAHPTYAEAFQEACRAALGQAIHMKN